MNSSTTLKMLHNPERYFMAIDWWIKPTFGLLIWCQWDVHPPVRKHSSWEWPCRAHQVRIMNIQLQDLSKLNVPWFAEIPTTRLIVSLLYFYVFLWPFRNLKLISMLSFHDCNSRSGSAPNRNGLQVFSNPILHRNALRISSISASLRNDMASATSKVSSTPTMPVATVWTIGWPCRIRMSTSESNIASRLQPLQRSKRPVLIL